MSILRTRGRRPSPQELEQSLESCVAQLESLYQDREQEEKMYSSERIQLKASVASLSERVSALRSERTALSTELSERKDHHEMIRRRAQRLLDDLAHQILPAS